MILSKFHLGGRFLAIVLGILAGFLAPVSASVELNPANAGVSEELPDLERPLAEITPVAKNPATPVNTDLSQEAKPSPDAKTSEKDQAVLPEPTSTN